MYRLTGVLILSAGLMAPLAMQAQEEHHDRDHDRDRYYDSDRRDYHQWTPNEERAWHRYWEEQHHAAVEWQRANEEQRRAYWRWRHEHPDSTLDHDRDRR